MRAVSRWLIAILGVIGLSSVLILSDGKPPSWGGWFAYSLVLGACLIAGWVSWRAVARERLPRWLLGSLIVAFALRIGLAVAFTHLLPLYGSGRRHQEAGYFYPDAYDRDRIAWELGRSERPLWGLSQRELRADQYGGLLLWTATVYRYLGTDAHRPLLMVLQVAAASALTVLFTWGFVSLTFGDLAAAAAAWVVALYPEGILLSSSQMREPLLGLGLALMLYGQAQTRQRSVRSGAGAVVVGALISLGLSPPAGLAALGVVLVLWLWGWERPRKFSPWAVAALAIGLVGGFILVVRAWSSAGVWGKNAFEVFLAWVTRTASYELYLLERSSGMVQSIFERTPAWAHVPLATAYGLLRPFLPAALFEPASPLARVVETWRAFGWLLLVPLLIYGLVAAPRYVGWQHLSTALAVIVWLQAALASFRAGADGWDNVRYRSQFLVMQAAVAGWAWSHARLSGSPWLGRIAVFLVVEIVVALQWYAGRYLGTPGLKLEATAVVAVAAAALVIGAFVVKDRWARKRLTSGDRAVQFNR